MNGNKVYIYALLDEQDSITYIGKSSQPKARLYNHSTTSHYSNSRIKILDYFYDTEDLWIKKMLNEGHPIQNNQIDITMEEWNIGDIISINKRIDKKVIDKTTGVIYKSPNDASVKIPLSYTTVKSILKRPNHKLKKLYNLEYTNQ